MFENYLVEGFLLVALIVLSWIDIKHREFPAVLTTGVLLVVAIAKYYNLTFGILAFVFAWSLMELEFFSGVADLKILTAIGFIIPDMRMFFILMILVAVFGLVWKILMIKVVKQRDETAFIPALLFMYIALLIIKFI